MFLKIKGGGQFPGCPLWLRAWLHMFSCTVQICAKIGIGPLMATDVIQNQQYWDCDIGKRSYFYVDFTKALKSTINAQTAKY